MANDRWTRVQQIFYEALEHNPEARKS